MSARGFEVRATACSTCIYRADSPVDLERLEAAVRDERGGFTTFRVCHHTKAACCRGFWNRHKDRFQVGQVMQRIGAVRFTDEDLYPEWKR